MEQKEVTNLSVSGAALAQVMNEPVSELRDKFRSPQVVPRKVELLRNLIRFRFIVAEEHIPVVPRRTVDVPVVRRTTSRSRELR